MHLRFLALRLVVLMALVPLGTAQPQAPPLPSYLRDRGEGISTSMAGVYITRGQVLIHPFYQYTRDHDLEYQPREFGAGANVDFRGRLRGHAAQLFLAYGATDWLALELEGGYSHEEFRKPAADTFATPATLKESGFADLEGQIRLRALRETRKRPEIFGFVELTARLHPSKFLIGSPYWDVRPGIGLTKGFAFGTLTARVIAEWNHEEKHGDLGEVTAGYLKRVSSAGLFYLGIEGGETGSMDEWELVPSVQWRLSKSVVLRVESPVGISPKATDWSPQVGVMVEMP